MLHFRGTETKKHHRKISVKFPQGSDQTFPWEWSRSERHVFLDFPCRQRGDLKDGDFPLVTFQHWNWREGFGRHFRLGVTSDTSEFFPMKNGSFDWCTSYFRYGRDCQPASLFLYCTAYHVSNPDWFQPLANWWLLSVVLCTKGL